MAFCPEAVLAYADDPATGTLNLFASVSGAYTLVIPASVELSKADGGKGIGTYSATIPVRVKGDLADNQYVTVSVATPTMTCSDGSTATVSLDNISKTEWSATDVAGEGTAADYAVSAVLGTPGAWNGTMSFGCEMRVAAPTTITFIVYNAYSGYNGPYTVNTGTTWAEFMASSNNTAGFYDKGGYVYAGKYASVYYTTSSNSYGIEVKSSDVIQYTTYHISDGPI